MPAIEQERERLIRHICEHMRLYAPACRVDDFFKMRFRLQKAPIGVIREIAELDLLADTFRKFTEVLEQAKAESCQRSSRLVREVAAR